MWQSGPFQVRNLGDQLDHYSESCHMVTKIPTAVSALVESYTTQNGVRWQVYVTPSDSQQLLTLAG